MHSVFFRGMSVISIIALSACGGGGGSSTSKPVSTKPAVTTPATSKPAASYSALLAEFVDISREYNVTSPYFSDTTNNSQMPTSGKATYTGVGAYKPNSIPRDEVAPLFGKAVLKADFKADKLTGKVTDFKAAPGHRTTGGTLNVDTDIVGTNSTGRMTGNLNLDGRDVTIDEEALGLFYGDNADAVGIISGRALTPGSGHSIAILGEK